MRRSTWSRAVGCWFSLAVAGACGGGSESPIELGSSGDAASPPDGAAADAPAGKPPDSVPASDPGAYPDAETNELPPAPDTPAVPKCSDGSIRCAENAVWSCKAGGWDLVEACGESEVCVHGECVCVPACEGKDCGPDGCGGACGTCSDGALCDDPTGTCVASPPPAVYTAVYVEDIWSGQCSSFGSSGADILGAALHAPGGELVGYWEEVVANPGTEGCPNSYTDPDVAIGPPGEDQLSLQGGYVAGTFPGKNAIGPGWSVTVYEFDGAKGGTSEPFSVWLATDLQCPSQDTPKGKCLVMLSATGNGTTTFQVGALP